MAHQIPLREPATIVAGETVKWRKSLPNYPPATWTLTYEFRGVGTFTITTTTDGSYHLANVDEAVSGLYVAGRYTWDSFVSDGSDRFRVGHGEAIVQADLADAVAGYDGRTFARRMLDAIEATIQGRATKETDEIWIGDRKLKRMKPADLEQWRALYKNEVRKEQQADRAAQGRDPQTATLVTFTHV